MLLLKIIQLLSAQNIIFCLISEQKSDLCGVSWVTKDSGNDLKHWCDSSSSGNHGKFREEKNNRKYYIDNTMPLELRVETSTEGSERVEVIECLWIKVVYLIVICEPLQQRHCLDDFHILSGFLICEIGFVLFFIGSQIQKNILIVRVLHLVSNNVQIFPADENFDSSHLKSSKSIFHSENVLSGILTDLVEISSDEFLLLNELHTSESVGSQLNSLVETIFTSICNIDSFDHFSLKSLVEHIRLAEFSLEISTTRKDESSNCDFVVFDEHLDGIFSYFTDVIVTLFITKTSKPNSRLSSSSVLLWQVDGKFVKNFPSISLKCSEQASVSVHDDKSEFVVVSKQTWEIETMMIMFLNNRYLEELLYGTYYRRDVIAPKTDSLFTRDLMFEAVPYSSANILLIRAT
ncbi:hypothetical protein GCK72_017925 [Caenorhabditis remanei]|uniref:Uncharacterized protein n=1 Tax=Caenorhabditis remanei TaxID=31234 RepID=A0A6A5G9B9_CAERE|nr:hypothetical protein GCK72_017925 [Caenorhabditis remanei]KAF1751371.1 hypothetical protein GCK72_017925 [Caenorhabditis remanei]